MAMLGAGGGQGPSLYMAIQARDRTGPAFNSVKKKMDNLSAVALTTMSKIGALSMSVATLGRVTGMLSNEQARVIGIFGTVISVMTTMASVVKMLTAIDWAHVTALVWKHSLLTLGIGVAIAAAAAMAVLAMQTRNAADSQSAYNTELERGLNAERRRTANRKFIRRGMYEEALD